MIRLGIFDRLDLGMRAACPGMEALTDDAILGHDDSTNRRIRAGEADAAFGLVDGLVHPAGVGVDSVGERH